MMDALSLLRSKQLFPLFITQFLGACNDNIFKNALIIFIVYHLAEGLHAHSELWVAFASGLFILPFFLFSTTAGQFADKYQKSNLLIKVKFIEVLLMPLAALGFYLNHLYLLLTVLFFLGMQAAFFGPLKYAILPELLPKKALMIGNGLIEAGTFIAILVGGIIGGVFILHAHGKAIISSILILLAVLGWLISWLIPLTPTEYPQHIVSWNIFKDTKMLFHYTQKRKDILLSLIGISWFWLFGSTIMTLLPQFTKNILHGDAIVVTFFYALFSIGIGLGAVTCAQLSKKEIHIPSIYFGLLGMTLFTFDLVFAAYFYRDASPSLYRLPQFLSHFSHYRFIMDAIGMAFFGGVYTVPLYTLLQVRTESTHRARVIAFNNIVNALFMIISALGIMGMAALNYTIPQMLGILGFLSAGMAGVFFKYRTLYAP